MGCCWQAETTCIQTEQIRPTPIAARLPLSPLHPTRTLQLTRVRQEYLVKAVFYVATLVFLGLALLPLLVQVVCMRERAQKHAERESARARAREMISWGGVLFLSVYWRVCARTLSSLLQGQ